MLNLDDKKAVKKRLTSFKPKPKPKPVEYIHMYKRQIPMSIKKQIYDLYQQNELNLRQISDRFGLADRTVSYIVNNYARQNGMTKEAPRHDERILALEFKVNRIERELNI